MFFEYLSIKDSLRWFSKTVLPFINSSSDADVINTFAKIVSTRTAFEDLFGQAIGEATNTKKSISIADNAKAAEDEARILLNKKTALRAVKESRDFLKTVLTIAFSDKEAGSDEINTKIEEALSVDYAVNWSRKGSCFAYPKTPDNRPGLICSIEKELTRLVTDLFQSVHTQEMPGILERFFRLGFDHVGMCPNCDVFFEKKRRDQEYCSDKCKKAAKMRRYRAK